MHTYLHRAITFLVKGLVASLSVGAIATSQSGAQSLSVLPVNINLTADRMASTITVANLGVNVTAVQVRVFAWSQVNGEDKLTPTDSVLVSPPIATIGAGDSQTVRIVLRKHPQDREVTYRILLDQIPPPAEPGVVHVVLKLSLPVFALPANHTSPKLHFEVQHTAGKLFLVATNDGTEHDSVREIALSTIDGRKLTISSTLPYVLAGSTRRWEISSPEAPLAANQLLKLTAHKNAGAIDQQVSLVEAP